MKEQRCLQTGSESVAPSSWPEDPQARADWCGDSAVPCGQIGPTEIHLGYSFEDVRWEAAQYLVRNGRENEWAESGLTFRQYLRVKFNVVSARVSSEQDRRDARRFRFLLKLAAKKRKRTR